jgi:uncharacterized membrane protein YfcA
MTPAGILALVAAAFGAGAMNAMAGGGTILTFPTLVFLGLPAITANATSCVALLPAGVASLFGYRREVREHRRWMRTLFVPSLLGGAIGSVLLLRTPEKTFAFLAPLLILFATVLFMIQGVLSRRTLKEAPAAEPDPSAIPAGRWATAVLLQLGVATYGGYFGAGIGILMLALLGFLGLANIHAANGIKNVFNLCINAVAAGYFIWKGAVAWPQALVLAAGGIVGGYGGARFARYIGKERARAAVVGIGLLVTAILFWQQIRK